MTWQPMPLTVLSWGRPFQSEAHAAVLVDCQAAGVVAVDGEAQRRLQGAGVLKVLALHDLALTRGAELGVAEGGQVADDPGVGVDAVR